MIGRTRRLVAIAAAVLLAGLIVVPTARAASSLSNGYGTREFRLPISADAQVYGYVTGTRPLRSRPVIVEFSTYGEAPGSRRAVTDAYNFVRVHLPGTGRSGGRFDVFGPSTQRVMLRVARWVCEQPFSDGRLGLYGDSASSIAAYALMRRHVPCLRAAVLSTGTANLYRDVAYVGGIPSGAIPAAFVGLVGAGMAGNGNPAARARRNPVSVVEAGSGLATSLAQFGTRPLEDSFYLNRSFSDPVDEPTAPILARTGFYDIEARGPVEAYMATRDLGSQLAILGGHEGNLRPEYWQRLYQRYFDHYVRGLDNGADREGPVHILTPIGGPSAFRAGQVAPRCAADWPLRGTRFQKLYLRGGPSGSAVSLNDGALRGTSPARQHGSDSYPYTPSNALATDPAVTGFAYSGAKPRKGGVAGAALEWATDLRAEGTRGLTYTSEPLRNPMELIGPASLHLYAKTTAAETDYQAVLADVAPDGTAKAVAIGKLRSTFPELDGKRTLRGKRGDIIRPYSVFSAKTAVPRGKVTEYHVEFWPMGNRFEAGHRLRLYLIGTPWGSVAPADEPAVNTVLRNSTHSSSVTLPVVSGRLPGAGPRVHANHSARCGLESATHIRRGDPA